MIDPLNPTAVAADAERVAALALAEDGPTDITSDLSVAAGQEGAGVVEARGAMTVAGLVYADAVVAAVGLPPIVWSASEGDTVVTPRALGTLQGDLRAILRAERPLLNLLQRGSGIATATASWVDQVSGTSCQVLHTRKTTPGLRIFEVMAVLAGGGSRHRLDLASALMVKDNHWAALKQAGVSLKDALDKARAVGVTDLQVEVESEQQLADAAGAGATKILIDNQPVEVVAAWLAIAREIRPDMLVEATGGISLESVRGYAETGVDFVSTGALTHSVRGADIGLELR